MAKVTGPLFSISATGKLSNALVYFPWKGRHVVRQWLKPANPKSADQGDQRLICGALGRSVSPIHTTSAFAADVRLFMAVGATWVSEMVKYMIDNVINDGTAWDALYTEYSTHTAKTDWDTEAAGINLHEFDIVYKGATNAAPAGMLLYLVGKCATNWELLGTKGFQRGPYTTVLASWTATEIGDMVAEFAAA